MKRIIAPELTIRVSDGMHTNILLFMRHAAGAIGCFAVMENIFYTHIFFWLI